MRNDIWNNKTKSRNEWWKNKRWNYNLGLILSGILAFFLYFIVVEFIVLKSEKNWAGELSVFSITFQGIGYLIMIGVANIFYNLGLISELIIKPKNPDKYRELIYKLGFWFSFSIPLLIPISLFIEFI